MQKLYFILSVLTAVLLTASNSRAQVIRTVALSSEPAPGLNGFVFDEFTGFPSLNNLGQVAFVSQTTDGGRVGVWSEGGGILHKTAYFGDISGVPRFFGPILNDRGNTAFLGLGSNGVNAVLVESGGQIEVVARVGQAAPGKPGMFGSQLTQAVFTDLAFDLDNDVAFLGRITGANNQFPSENLVWFKDETGLRAIAHQGKTAPTVGFPYQVSNLGSTEILINPSGAVAFDADITHGSSLSQGGIVYAGQPTDLRVVARGNTRPNGFPSGVIYLSLGGYSPGGLSMNSVGDVVFDGYLYGPGINDSNNSAIWAETKGQTHMIAREGGSVSGLESTTVFGSGLNLPLINRNGVVAFECTLAGPNVQTTNDEAFWVGPLDSPMIAVQEGDAIPGVEAEARFRSLRYSDNGLSLNANGQIAFKSELVGVGINNANDVGIWATDIAGDLQLIVREGNTIEVRPGVFRTVQELHFAITTNNEDGHASAFNVMGQIAFRAVFTDGSQGVFVSNLVAIPEPVSAVLITLYAVLFVSPCGSRARDRTAYRGQKCW